MRKSIFLAAAVALNASMLLAIGEARVAGKVTDASTKAPIAGAVLKIEAAKGAPHSFHQEVKIDKTGSYTVFLLDATMSYDFTWSAPGYQSYVETMKLQLGVTNNKDVALQPMSTTAASSPSAAAPPKPDPAVAAYNEGASLANAGKVPEAIAKMEEAAAAKPDFAAAYEGLARLYLRQKDYPKAIDRANKALALDPDDPAMNGVLYDAYTATGDAKAAQYKSKMPANAGVLFNEAAAAINSGKDAAAEPLLLQAITVDPKFAPSYYELGMLYVRAGKNADARTNLQKYLELDPNGKDAALAKESLKYVK